MEVTYQIEPELSLEEYADVLNRSTLAERRPVDRPDLMQKMLENSNLIVTARVDGKLVGISRAMTDFGFSTYLADLAVDEAFQHQGIGKELVVRTHQAAGLHTLLVLIAAPKARGYYPKIGMEAHDSCWIIPRDPSVA